MGTDLKSVPLNELLGTEFNSVPKMSWKSAPVSIPKTKFVDRHILKPTIEISVLTDSIHREGEEVLLT